MAVPGAGYFSMYRTAADLGLDHDGDDGEHDREREDHRPAPRPAHSVLVNRRLAETIGDDMPPWSDALARFMASLGYGGGGQAPSGSSSDTGR